MAKNLRETIKEITFKHLKKKRFHAYGQCLTAVGWVGGTLPELYEKDGMIEFPMSDVAGGGFVVGSALAGKRPMYIIRYQGFNWFNSPIILNYACKSKEIWKVPCPIFIRGIAMEGGIGPVAGSSHHSLYYRMPGIKIVSPMSPLEYKNIYSDFMKNNDVMYVSEHRGSYNNSLELKNIYLKNSDITIFAISITRFAALEASKILKEKYNIKISLINVIWLKPQKFTNKDILYLKKSKYGGLVLDDDYEDGISKSIANNLSLKTNKKIYTLGLENKSAGFSKNTDNLPPDAQKIVKKVKKIIYENKK